MLYRSSPMEQLFKTAVGIGKTEARLVIFWLLAVVAFTGGAFAMLPYGEMIQKLIVIVFSLMLVVIQRYQLLTKASIIVVLPYILYIGYSFVSSAILFESFILAAFALQPLVVGLFIYLWAISFPLDRNLIVTLKRFVVLLILSQFLVALIKLVVHGIDEKVLIGTMSHVAGQLGFLFPAIMVPIVVFMARSIHPSAALALIMLLFAFGVINEKRSVVFLLPILLLFSYMANGVSVGKGGWSQILVALLLSVGVALAGMSLIPSLNEEESYGGGLSVMYAFDYAIDYLTMDYGGGLQGSYDRAMVDKGVQVGRLVLWASILNWVSTADVTTLLFGLGYGCITPSSWLSDNDDLLFDAIGTRGAISGAAMALIETGLIGLALMSIFFVGIFVFVLRAKAQVTHEVSKRWLGTILVVFFVFVYDYFFYSIVLFRTMPMPYLFFTVVASAALIKQWDARNFLRMTGRTISTIKSSDGQSR